MKARPRALAIVICAGMLACPGLCGAAPAGVTFDKVLPLKPREGVFAYSRISPDGRTLAYASEMPIRGGKGAVTQTVTVVDLASHKTLFTEPGIDAYWSLDGQRIIYSSYLADDVSIWRRDTGAISRNVAPTQLGDYYSWAVRDGQQFIMTIDSNDYALDGDKALTPGRVVACPDIGVGDRPLVSKDGKRITTFVAGDIVVRDIGDCDNIFDTGVEGAKADFSYDGRYIAFHDAKTQGSGSQIEVIDLEARTIRTITSSLAGSSLFPSWTQDGRLSFRYDGADYRGFMMADNVLSAPERPLPPPAPKLSMNRQWRDIFPETPRPPHQYTLVMIWGTWSAHSPVALRALQQAKADFAARKLDVAVLTAPEPSTYRTDLDRIRRQNAITLPEIPLTPAHFARTEASNQIPSTLLFRGDQLIDRRLGPLSYEDLRGWIGGVVKAGRAAQ